jgi:hypothetical protein
MHLPGDREEAKGRELRISQMIEAVHKDMESFPDHRRGRNIQEEIADAGMAAL